MARYGHTRWLLYLVDVSLHSTLSNEICGPSICSMGNNFCVVFNLAHFEADQSRKTSSRKSSKKTKPKRRETASATRIKTKSGTLYSIIRLRDAGSSFSGLLLLLFETNAHTTNRSSSSQNWFFYNSGTVKPSSVNVSKTCTLIQFRLAAQL